MKTCKFYDEVFEVGNGTLCLYSFYNLVRQMINSQIPEHPHIFVHMPIHMTLISLVVYAVAGLSLVYNAYLMRKKRKIRSTIYLFLFVWLLYKVVSNILWIDSVNLVDQMGYIFF